MAHMCLVLALLTVSLTGAMAQSGCTNALLNMSPCLNYVTGNSSSPSSSCCSQLGAMVQSSPQCLCSLLNGAAPNLGVNINQTLALTLPGACNVNTPPVSQCNAAAGPPASGGLSPVGSPVNPPSDDSDETPNNDGSISPSSISGGSKTVPSTDNGNTSDARTVGPRGPFSLLLLAIAFASIVTKLFYAPPDCAYF